ncbi:class 1 fructose-bisphosphatase [Paracraurococcus lichenis]|uniref:Fructose-1,6-bisphosphatase class 1 n=1 Tax=Paracraurococcus lichenis TaxID=3064888 RepID=A0ABT9E366_9PROT|nr:class 1 fructose-bisphosphatase [Paracraurococcus sp. LOR1-02]MDO9710547.1 class 1 fructose-bisphosphatase [Paracraurococcus sp. LOR1-02]
MTLLAEHLRVWAGASAGRQAIAETVAALARASTDLAEIVADGPLAGELGRVIGASEDGDGQKALDVRANDLFLDHLRAAPVAAVASEEMPEAIELRGASPIAVALDPLDGSNNIDIDAPMGSLFTLLPSERQDDPRLPFVATGDRQLAAGFVLYGPHTVLMLTLGEGVQAFTLDRRTREFRLTRPLVRIPEARREYAINAANARHWPLPIRAFVEECIAGAAGPRGVDYNTRWLGCVVAEAYRVLLRGGIYLYPGDARPGYERGRLRLVYEANPIALLLEQAGGTATDGFTPILEIPPRSLHQRVPLIFGSHDKVSRVVQMHLERVPDAGQRPLFGARGLFRS